MLCVHEPDTTGVGRERQSGRRRRSKAAFSVTLAVLPTALRGRQSQPRRRVTFIPMRYDLAGVCEANRRWRMFAGGGEGRGVPQRRVWHGSFDGGGLPGGTRSTGRVRRCPGSREDNAGRPWRKRPDPSGYRRGRSVGPALGCVDVRGRGSPSGIHRQGQGTGPRAACRRYANRESCRHSAIPLLGE